MPIFQFLIIIAIGFLLFSFLLNAVSKNQQQRQIEESFYALLDAQNGQISLIQLAVAARVNASLAKQYLQQQVKVFGATLEVDADGDIFYRFPKLRPANSTNNSERICE